MTRTLLTLLLVIPCIAFGQNKIGNLTITEKQFNDYILDCYKHPDTLKLIDVESMYPKGRGMFDGTPYIPYENKNKEIAATAAKYGIGHITKTDYHPATIDTIYDGISEGDILFNGQKINKSKVRKIEYKKVDAWSYTYDIGYLVPRIPTEQDFIKWYTKTQSK